MKALPAPDDPDLLVGFEASDDAAVYRVTDEIALITTTDFITPPVDDPVWFGRIAAANALSDVYAMGGRPLTALNLVMFPIKALGAEILRGVLAGGQEKVAEAGAVLVGGHSVDDAEPKYGLAVTGEVHPDRIWRNGGARPGDALVLTKPLGTGVLFNACVSGRLPRVDLDPVLPVVASLNRAAAETAAGFGPTACTDVTGFGLAGHALELCQGSDAAVELAFDDLPLHPNAVEMYRVGVTTGSNGPNRDLVAGRLEVSARLRPEQAELLFDPQTSGGLLLAVPGDRADALVSALHAAGVPWARRVGRVVAGPPAVRVL